MSKISTRMLRSISAFALLSAGSSFAYAQDGAQTASEDTRRLQSVTVTSQKREQNIQDVPISISAYSGEFIEESGVENLTELSLYTPNFQILQSTQVTNQRIVIRGVGSTGQSGIEPSVATFIDGVYYGRPGSIVGNLLDVETVEVLRGPQGTLFGRNSAAGALNVTTKSPSFDTLEGKVQVRAGDYGAMDLSGVVSGPISDKIAFSLAGKYSEFDGFGFNLLDGEDFGELDNTTLRGKLAFEPTDRLSITFAADYSEVNSNGPTVEFFTGSENPVFLGTLAALFGPDVTQLVTDDPTDHEVYSIEEGQDQNNEQWGVSADISYELGSGHRLRSITAYREFEAFEDQTVLDLPVSIFPRNFDLTNEALQQEFQLISPSGEDFEYVLGAFFYDESYAIEQTFNVGPQLCVPLVFALAGANAAALCAAGPTAGHVDAFDQDLSSYAFYGEGTYNFNERWALTAGIRYTNDEKNGQFTAVSANPIFPAIGARAQENFGPVDIKDEEVTYRINVSYFPSDDVMLFATHSTGFKSSGFNTDGVFPALAPEARLFDAETSNNYEVGIKSEFFNNSLQANVTAYRTEYENFQDRSFDGVSFLVRNVGELRSQGVEADFTWLPTDQLTLFASAAYQDAEFIEYPNAAPLPGGTPQDLSGTTPNYAPEWQGSIVADWLDDLPGTQMEYFLRGEYQYNGDQNVGAITNNNPQAIQDAVSLINARAGLNVTENLNVSVWGRNLTDEGYCTAISEQPFGAALGGTVVATNTTATRCIVAAPRTYGIELNYGF